MEGESSSSSSSWRSRSMVSVKQVFPSGSESELLRIENVALWLMNYEDFPVADVIRAGKFSLRVVVQSISPILISLCVVGDLQWPITKDAPVLRVGCRSFAFAMPGLLYGVQFPESCCLEQLQVLASLFEKFAHFEDHSMIATGIEFSVPDFHPRFWAVSQPKIQRITVPQLNRIGTMVGKASTFLEGMNEGLMKVTRMSGVAKLITKGVLVGALNQDHIDIFDTRPRPDESKDPNSSRAFPTIFMFSDVVEAVEVTGIFFSGNILSMPECHPTWNPVQGVKLWNINKKGLMLVLHALTSSAAIYNGDVEDMAAGKSSGENMVNLDAMEEDGMGEEAVIEEGGKDDMEDEDQARMLNVIKFPIMKGTD
ncbi:uncharacterized protein LOC122074937 isoform X2 [Macadamia integrifolia]|uniref:uncharacterized protein LOC122074937 isoform X2 n=1 Tax=Macadamia integrifolia TaxID=60698 RepID=UPI001C4EB95A|nr:uncharacterized protein LOC122074937 isoform X2 [Macadamia integrifolia]